MAKDKPKKDAAAVKANKDAARIKKEAAGQSQMQQFQQELSRVSKIASLYKELSSQRDLEIALLKENYEGLVKDNMILRDQLEQEQKAKEGKNVKQGIKGSKR
jgi:hypothetical protein